MILTTRYLHINPHITATYSDEQEYLVTGVVAYACEHLGTAGGGA
jgi:hypothetical protein